MAPANELGQAIAALEEARDCLVEASYQLRDLLFDQDVEGQVSSESIVAECVERAKTSRPRGDR